MRIHGDLDVKGTTNFAPKRARLTTSSFTASNVDTIIPEIGQAFPGPCDGTNSFRVTVSLNFSAAASGSDVRADIGVHVGTTGTIADSTAYEVKHVVHGTILTTMSVTFMLVGVHFPSNENNVKLSISVELQSATTASITRELVSAALAQTIIELVP